MRKLFSVKYHCAVMVATYALMGIHVCANAAAENPASKGVDVRLNQQEIIVHGAAGADLNATQLPVERQERVPREFIKFLPPVATDGLPVSYQESQQESHEPEEKSDLCVILSYVFKQFGLIMAACFLFGLICGGAFGWPPLSGSR